MHTALMVEESRSLMTFMAAGGLRLRAAVWVYLQGSSSWRLWLVPPRGCSDRNEFYRHLAGFFLNHRDLVKSFDASDIEMMPATDPALVALRKMVRMTGEKEVFIRPTRLGEFELAKGIVVRLEI